MTPAPVDVVVLVPMLGRAHQVDPLVTSLAATTDRARCLFICSAGDIDVADAVAGLWHIIVPRWETGDYAGKINAGYRASSEPLMFLAASDVRFHPRWLEACEAQLAPGIGVVGTNDLGNPRTATGDLSTHTLVTRVYADQCGTIDQPHQVLHEGYPHEFVDDELVATAKHRGAYAHAADAVVEHLHPAWGKAPPDRSYAGSGPRMAAGRRLFIQRKRLWARSPM